MFFFDPLYLLFAAPGLLLAFRAQSRVKVVFAEYSEVGLTRRQTGAQIAPQTTRCFAAANRHSSTTRQTKGCLK